MKKLALHWQVIIGLILGTIYAFFAVKLGWNQFTLDYIMPFGTIFISLLKLIAVPLVLFSVISGIISLKDVTKLGRIGIKTLSIYLITTMFAVSLGLVLVNIIQPGKRVADSMRMENRVEYELWRDATPGVMDLDEICLSCDEANKELIDRVRAKSGQPANAWVEDKLKKADVQKGTGPLQPLVDIVPTNIFKALVEMSMLQIIFFAIFFGIVMVLIPKEKSEPIAKLIDGLNEVFIQMVWVIMKAMPFFVFALMAGQIVKAAGSDPDKFAEILTFLGWYGLVVMIGLGLLIFIVYPLIARGFAGLSFKKFFSGIRDAQFTAFATSSSVATLPVTMDCLENKIGVSKPVTSFVLPIGATVNMDGTSLYQAIAVVSMAQYHMIDLSITQQFVIVLTATLASIGAAAIPSAGLVLMIVVLESVGLNPAWIAIIFPIDRILDMCRTVVNVTGDATVASLVAKSEGELNAEPEE
jgi:Na+/H+-dicarboxylate symporter